jgi:hypothetical protein
MVVVVTGSCGGLSVAGVNDTGYSAAAVAATRQVVIRALGRGARVLVLAAAPTGNVMGARTRHDVIVVTNALAGGIRVKRLRLHVGESTVAAVEVPGAPATKEVVDLGGAGLAVQSVGPQLPTRFLDAALRRLGANRVAVRLISYEGGDWTISGRDQRSFLCVFAGAAVRPDRARGMCFTAHE